jgi:predicted RNase H-like HicB family nuclease
MVLRYIETAMRRATYEILTEDGSYYGEIPGFQGVFANAPTLEECREQLQEVLEDWILLSVAKNLPLPVIDGMTLRVSEVA